MTSWLGIDPGPTRCGWALVEIDGRAPPRFVEGGHCLVDDVASLFPRADRIALEWLAPGLFKRERHDSLIDTARVEGGLVRLIELAGKSFLRLSAGQWRTDVCRNASASDDLIAEVVSRRVMGLRSLSATERAHVNDAIGVVLAAACGPSDQIALALGARRPRSSSSSSSAHPRRAR